MRVHVYECMYGCTYIATSPFIVSAYPVQNAQDSHIHTYTHVHRAYDIDNTFTRKFMIVLVFILPVLNARDLHVYTYTRIHAYTYTYVYDIHTCIYTHIKLDRFGGCFACAKCTLGTRFHTYAHIHAHMISVQARTHTRTCTLTHKILDPWPRTFLMCYVHIYKMLVDAEHVQFA